MTDPYLWWRDGVICQIYPRSFADSNNDGLGDLLGITSQLDYLAHLGIDAIWLSPFYPSPDVDFGYDISNHCGVDPRFGARSDFDDLVREAHRRNIRVVLDFDGKNPDFKPGGQQQIFASPTSEVRIYA